MAKVVSSEDELLIMVDAKDRQTGTSSKADCHDGDGVLHRAFSIFLFNQDGELLLQQRAAGKRLWPMFWSNSCCSHPRAGESLELAASRRLDDELHTKSELRFVYSFEYHASFGDLGSEHELCHVFLGRVDTAPVANETEIAALRFVSVGALEQELAQGAQQFTPWFKLEWERLTGEFSDVLGDYTASRQPT